MPMVTLASRRIAMALEDRLAERAADHLAAGRAVPPALSRIAASVGVAAGCEGFPLQFRIAAGDEHELHAVLSEAADEELMEDDAAAGEDPEGCLLLGVRVR